VVATVTAAARFPVMTAVQVLLWLAQPQGQHTAVAAAVQAAHSVAVAAVCVLISVVGSRDCVHVGGIEQALGLLRCLQRARFCCNTRLFVLVCYCVLVCVRILLAACFAARLATRAGYACCVHVCKVKKAHVWQLNLQDSCGRVGLRACVHQTSLLVAG
jgi:hypothetical protein